MRRIVIVAAAGTLSAAAWGQSEPGEPCCGVIAIQIDEAEPGNNIVTARNLRTGELVRFRLSAGEAASVQLRQPVRVDPQRRMASIGSLRAPLIAASPVSAPAAPAAPAAASAATAAPGIPCSRLNADGRASGSAVLTVNVNGQDVGTFDGGVSSNLEDFMTPGPNTVRLTFSAADGLVNAELRCLRPGESSSRNRILTLRPSVNRLTAQTQVNYQPR